MRITGDMISRNYTKRLNTSLSYKWNSEKKIQSLRQFERASECPAQAASAMRVRKALNNLDRYKENLKTADNIYSNAESSVIKISTLIQNTYEKCIEAANGTNLSANTHTPDQLQMIAQSVETFGDEMVRLMNLNVADRRIFGGVNNSTNPYTVTTNASGSKTVNYNGVSVNAYDDHTQYPSSSYSYADIGLGMTLLDDGTVDPQSALQLTFNGAEILGCGVENRNQSVLDLSSIGAENTEYQLKVTVGKDTKTISFAAGADTTATIANINTALEANFGKDVTINNAGVFNSKAGKTVTAINDPEATGKDTVTLTTGESGYSKNVIQNIYDAAEAIRNGDGLEIARFADQVYSLQTTVSLALADIGNSTQFIEFNQERITENITSLQDRQNDLESTDIPSETTALNVYKALYDACLQMSATSVPTSIFQFMR